MRILIIKPYVGKRMVFAEGEIITLPPALSRLLIKKGHAVAHPSSIIETIEIETNGQETDDMMYPRFYNEPLIDLKLVTPPTAYPVELDEAKIMLKMPSSNDQEDDFILNQIKSATSYAEEWTQRALITQTWDVMYKVMINVVHLPRPPFQKVQYIKWRDVYGLEHTVDSNVYFTVSDGEVGLIHRKWGFEYPFDVPPLYYKVRFDAGYGSSPSSVPMPIKNAILTLVLGMYEHGGIAPQDYFGAAEKQLSMFTRRRL